LVGLQGNAGAPAKGDQELRSRGRNFPFVAGGGVHRFDDIDVHILKELQRDSSRTNVELGRAVGLTPPACLRRVHRLRKSGAIRGEMAVLDPRLVGPALTVVVAVDMASEGREALAAFRARVLAESAVAQCWYVSGRHDFILVVGCPTLPLTRPWDSACSRPIPTSRRPNRWWCSMS
jgi:Lrp/AsnC family transcriptional regulator, leucine-responsive regulatory protein